MSLSCTCAGLRLRKHVRTRESVRAFWCHLLAVRRGAANAHALLSTVKKFDLRAVSTLPTPARRSPVTVS